METFLGDYSLGNSGLEAGLLISRQRGLHSAQRTQTLSTFCMHQIQGKTIATGLKKSPKVYSKFEILRTYAKRFQGLKNVHAVQKRRKNPLTLLYLISEEEIFVFIVLLT